MKAASTTLTLIAIGANLPFNGQLPADIIQDAYRMLEGEGLELASKSQLYSSPAFPAGSGPDYINSTAIITSNLSLNPEQILAILHKVELAYGRTRDKRWAGRTLDLDLLAHGDSVLPDAETQSHWRHLSPDRQSVEAPDRLILPHPRMQDRAFVLVPLLDIAPDWCHPLLGKTVREMHDALPQAERDCVRPL